jgi:hypothetical protein
MITFWAIIKFLALFIGLWFTFHNITTVYYKATIQAGEFIVQALAITIFIWLQWIN